MENDFMKDGMGPFTMPDEAFKEACAGYCRMAMVNAGVSADARDFILDSLWDTFAQISVEAAQTSWKNR